MILPFKIAATRTIITVIKAYRTDAKFRRIDRLKIRINGAEIGRNSIEMSSFVRKACKKWAVSGWKYFQEIRCF